MIKRIAQNTVIAGITVLLTLALLEGVVRMGGSTNADGQFTFMGYTLEPYVLPVHALRDKIEAFLEREDHSPLIYDERLGWSHHPNQRKLRGGGWMFTSNDAGLRSQREYSQQPLPHTLRIALFGDSFTAGEEVNDDETWGHQLELELNQAGIRTEVLNFGVSGYGMDQALLRWRHQGQQYAPDIVIFGFQPTNLDRNVNVFRQLYYPGTGIPFSKPRFVLNGQELTLLNSPTIPPAQLAAVFESFENHPLAAYEHYYDSCYVASQWWASSRLAGYLYQVLKSNENSQEDYGPSSERGQLGQAIVDAFAKEAMAQEAAFFVLYLPYQWPLIRYHKNRTHPYQFLLDHFDDAYHYISMEDHLERKYVDDAYWSAREHYGPEINRRVAQAAADEIQACIESAACDLPRFEDRSVIFTAES